MCHLGTSDFAMTHSGNKKPSPQSAHFCELRKLHSFLLGSDLVDKKPLSCHVGWVQERLHAAILRLSPAQNRPQQKHSSVLASVVGRKLVYTVFILKLPTDTMGCLCLA